MARSGLAWTIAILCVVLVGCTKGWETSNDPDTSLQGKRALRHRIARAVAENASQEDVTTTEAPPSLKSVAEEFFGKVAKMALPYVQELAYDENIPTECMRSLTKIGAGIRRFDFWALKFVDSLGRPPSGIMEGTVAGLGSYDECRSIRVPKEESDAEDFRGRYCTLYFKPKAIDAEGVQLMEKYMNEHPLMRKHLKNIGNLTHLLHELTENVPEEFEDAFGGMRFGVCIPSKCSVKDLKYIAEKLTSKYGLLTTVRGCSVDQPVVFTKVQITMFCLIGMSSLLVVVSSVMEIYFKGREKHAPVKPQKIAFPVRLIMCFSAVNNTRILMNTKVVKNSDQQRLRCLHGMRVFSFLWVIIGHTYSAVEPHSVGRGIAGLEYLHDFWFTFIMNGFLAVETFFFMSGFLTSYGVIIMNQSASMLKLVPVAVGARYVRLTVPALAFVGFFYVYPLIPRGPIADEWIWYMLNNCDKYWWDVLLQSTNYRPSLQMCMPHLWYLGTDFQLFLIMLLLVFFMVKKPKFGLPVMGSVVVVGSIALGVMSYVNNYGPLAFTTARGVKETLTAFKELYHKPVTHLAPFTLGILAAYFVLRFPNYRIKTIYYYSGWVAAWVGGLGCLFIVYPWNIGGGYTNFGSSLHTSGHRVVWGLCLAWVVFVCGTGQSKWVNGFLSHPGWVPVSRLTFAGYMLHILVVAYKALIARQPLYMDHWLLVKDFLGHSVLTIMVSYIFFILCECPTGNVVKVTLQYWFPEIMRPSQFSFGPVTQAKAGKVLDGDKPKELTHVSNDVFCFTSTNGVTNNGATTNGVAANGVKNGAKHDEEDGTACCRV